ncbi:Spy0128 family protein [Collinsella aerofaciens]|uniref:Spy0128 family protein n=1 Tax=Collinsella aerofaciens TaxID=74426 RepID=UPI0018A8DC63|nr:FctA domain-containing protein [Collinsella aerofaciens]MDB1827411.1 SpaA isopeptide-forming pilin-related protein [Collinsella aerofaciens]MDB1832940.1 SpaA isopeptide-forming pilin-related protein [Collinsella aerofaciens]
MSYGRRRGLRPVSPYVIVLALAVALTASFFLPTRAEAAFSDHTVTTISPSGTTINLFDYWVNPDDHLSVSGNGGINANHRFQFNDGQGGESLNRWTGGENPQSGIVSNTLFDGYPRLSDTWGGKSLRYLFDSSAQTGKTSHFGVTGLLQAQGGYYVYDSTHNYAAYNANKNAFDIYDTGGVGNSSHQGQFFPFDAADKVFNEENDRLVQNGITADNTASYNGGKPVNHHFGLSMSTRFVQSDGGKTNKDEDMTFEFAGDDDVWVFIDDVLVGDIGGIHDRASLNINFKTGDIKVNGKSDGTLLSKYQNAGKDGDTRWYGSTFADGTNHTLKFFYLERGALYSNMELKFNLVTVPESDIIKFDQDGKFVQGAEFQLYKTDKDFKTEGALLGSGTTDEAGCLTLTNDDGSGVINFDDLYNKDHSNKYYLLKETSVPKGYRSNLTTTDGSMRLEYEPTSDKNGAGGVIINRGGMDAGSAVWRTGAFAGAKETITAPSIVYKANDDLTKSNDAVSLDSGILFAVVLKRDKSASIKDPSSWYAVSGDPSTGAGYTLAKEPGTAGAIEAAKKDLHAFTLNTSGQYQVEIQNLPGDISKYYYLLSGEARKDAEYTVAIYHTTARSIGDATPKNTVHVYSDDIADGTNFKRQFATRLLVTNIQNRLFVQKTDTEGNPVDGATFGLYKATTDANGKVVPKDDQGPYDTLTTGSVDNPVRLEGAGIFPCTSDGNKPLKNGTYFLKEVSAPKGFLLNDTLTKVIVDDDGVHADAGTDDDGVSTFVGPGALMKSLDQFGAEGDIDNTLTWIKGTRQTSNGETNVKGNLTWTDVEPVGADDTVHLKYGANGRMYQYGPTEEGKPYRLETETGWIRMGITQDEQPKGITAKGARADLGAMNLNALFTGATCVRVANEREASLEVTKKVVVPDGLTGNKDAGFTFKFTVPKGKTYKAAVFEKAGTVDEKQVGNVFDLTNGYSQTIKADETIRVYGLGEGDEYTVQELTGADEMPAGYKLTGRKQGDKNLTGVGDGIITGKIAKQNTDGTLAEDNKLVFTNSYSVKSSVTLTGIRAQKVLQGRKWTKADSFDIYLRAAKGTPMPGGYKGVSGVPGYVQVVKTVNNGDEFDFGQITYKKPGTYTYTVAERTPDEHDSSWLPGFGYSSAGYTVTVQVDDTGRGTLSEPVVTMARNGDDDGAHHDPAVPVDNKVAVFTNKFSTDTKTISFNAQKSYTDESGDNPLAAGKFTFELKALGGLANSAVGAAPIKFNDLSYTVSANDAPMPADGVTTAENDGGGIAAFPQITFTAADQNTTYVYQVTEQAGSDASTTGGMTYDTTVYYAMVQNTLDDKGQLSSTATYWKADGTQLTDTGGYIPFKNTYTVAQTMLAPVTVQKTLAGRAWEQDDKFDFTLTPADDATMKAVKNKVVTQKKAADSDETGDLTTKVEIAGPGDAMRTTPFGTGDLVFTRPGVYTFKVNETRPTDADKTGISYDDHTSTVTYTVTDIENGTHTGKLTASVAYDNKQATTDADRQVTGAAAFTNTYAASGTYAGIDVTKTLVGTPLENGRFPFTIEAMTYNGTKAPEPVDSDKSFTNTVGKDDGDDTQTATMSGKLKMNFTQLSYNKMYVYKVSEVHDANAAGYTYDTEYPGDAFVLIAVKPNPDNKGQLYTKTTIVKGPDVTALVGVGDNVDALTAEAIKGLNTTTNYVQTVSSRGAKPATPIVPFKNEYKVETVEYGAKAGLQIEKKFTGTGDASRTFSFTVTPEDYQAEGQDGTKFILTSADAAAKKLDITGGAETFKIPEMKLGDTKTVSLLPKGLQFTHDDVSNECRANVYQYRVEENVPKPVPAGYTYDKTVYTVKIAVSDNGDGTLKVETTVLNSDGKRVDYRKFAPGASLEDNTATIPFENSYKTVASDELTPQVTKKISGTESTDKKFSFTLTATSETKDKIAAGDLKADGLKGDTSSESKTTEGKITSKDGQPLSFSGMQFNKAGDYTFTLTEAHGEDDDPNTTGVQNAGWTMDDSTYTVTVKVEDKNAKLTVTGVAVEKDGDDKSETLEVKNGKVNLVTFTNSYAAKGSVTLAAKKRFTGGALAGNDFSFALYKGDKTEGTPIETGTNDKNGNITFQPINYTESGDYEYTIKEVTGNDQTIVYDGQKVKVKVSVTDNKNGTLDATATYDGDEAVPTFTNAKPTADATIEAKKTLTGKDLTEGAFNFGLYQGDASTGNPVQLAQNDKDGKINFALTGLTIGEYDYILKEENVGADPTITYDTKAVKVHVSVKAEGGKAKATVTYDGKNDAPTFENTYQPAETSVALAAKKTYVKSDSTPAALKGGEFTFNLYKGDLTAEQLKGKQPIRTAENGEDGTVTFPAIDYTKAGEHKYTVAEQKGDLSHVTYDATVHHAVVTVVDNAGKLEASVTYDDGKTDAPTFKNTYTAKGSAELTATKVVAVAPGFTHDTKLKGGEYTFDLKDAAGNVLDTATNKADGTVKFTRDFELSDLDGAASKDFTYTIAEQPGAEAGMVYDNHALTYTVTVTDGGNGALNAKAIVTSTSGPETFTNIYQPAATGLALGAQKSYVKKDDNTPIVLKGGEFTFDVYEGNLTAEQLAGAEPVRTATNGADGSVNFDAFSYAKPGTHEYTIVERKGDLACVTYDAAVHHAVVTVADNAGTLQASVAYDGANVTKPTFTNTYEAKATDSGAIALTKSVNVHDGSYQLKEGDFAFELMGSDGSVIQTQKNDADGKVAFDKLTFDHAGTFTYTVREVQPTVDAPGVPGVTYTGKTYTLTYVVKDNNDGKLVVESSTVKPSEGTENGVSPGTMTFANSYQPGQTSYQISGTKVLKNADPATTRTPADGEFTFALIDVATGQVIDRTTNVGKAFTFKAISYTATGSHEYQVKEVAGQDATITYSDAVLDVTVSVTDDGSGQLIATANKTAADLTFTNTYTPTATTATITGTKALTGRDLAEGEFSFDLKDADGNVVQTVQNGADGTFGFAPLQLDKVGTYVYTVSERAGATANGVTYDTTVFTATVTVTENAETHALETQVAYSKGGKAADAVAFSNSYAPAATEVKLGASKVLSGEDLKEGQFSFQLKDADGKVLQTAKNAADGTVGFEAISYDKPGTYAYSISEVDDGQKNVTYDAAEHRVTVTVTDDGAGHLVATVTYDGDVAPVFKNTYTPPTTPPTEPPTNPPSKSPVPKEEKPGLPYTGDTSLSPMALGGIAGGAVVLIAAGVILRRRNR